MGTAAPAIRRTAAGAGSPHRIGAIAESATLAVDAKAKALKAAGRTSSASAPASRTSRPPTPSSRPPSRPCRDPQIHRYTPAGGLPELKEAIAEKTAARQRLRRRRAGQVLVTNGGKQAVYEAFATLLDPGDEVLLPAPYWTTYPEAIRLAGGVPVEVSPTGRRATGSRSSSSRRPAPTRTKVLLFVLAVQPDRRGRTRREEVEAIGRWAVEHGIWVVTDEIYEHLVYGGAECASMPVAVPELADRCVVVNGVAKTYAMTGWRVGWLIGPADVVKAATNLQSHATSNVANVAQARRWPRSTGDLSAVAEMRAAFDRRRQTMVSAAQRDPRRGVPGAARRVLLLPVGEGAARQDAARHATPTTSASWPS